MTSERLEDFILNLISQRTVLYSIELTVIVDKFAVTAMGTASMTIVIISQSRSMASGIGYIHRRQSWGVGAGS